MRVVVESKNVRVGERAEAVGLGALSRVLVSLGRFDRSLRWLDRLPTAAPEPQVVVVPSASVFRGAGACLSRSLARSQYLRRRGVRHSLVLGVRRSDQGVAAHAWLDPFDDEPDYVELTRFER